MCPLFGSPHGDGDDDDSMGLGWECKLVNMGDGPRDGVVGRHGHYHSVYGRTALSRHGRHAKGEAPYVLTATRVSGRGLVPS